MRIGTPKFLRTPFSLFSFGRTSEIIEFTFFAPFPLQFAFVSEMTYTVSSGTLNSSIPYHLQFALLFALRESRNKKALEHFTVAA